MNAREGRGEVAGAKALSVVIAALLAACGGLIQGFDTGGISNASATIVKQFHLTSGLQGVVTSMVLVGAMIGSAVGGLLADKFGRRKMLIVCGATFCAGVLIEVFASGLSSLLFGRAIAGLSIGIASIQQITGINAVMYYAPSIFVAAGFTSTVDAIADDLLLALLLVIVTFVASRLVDRRGRRSLMLWGLAAMVLALLILGAAFASLGRSPIIPWLILAGLLLYIAGFALGPGPCIWLVIAEIYPLEVRGPAMSIATLASWLANLFVSSTFPVFSHGVGESNAFYIFGLVSPQPRPPCPTSLPPCRG
jgi:MFS family permease